MKEHEVKSIECTPIFHCSCGALMNHSNYGHIAMCPNCGKTIRYKLDIEEVKLIDSDSIGSGIEKVKIYAMTCPEIQDYKK